MAGQDLCASSGSTCPASSADPGPPRSLIKEQRLHLCKMAATARGGELLRSDGLRCTSFTTPAHHRAGPPKQPPVRLGRRQHVVVSAAAASESLPPMLPVDPKAVKRMRLKTRSDCALGVSVYPNFVYNAVGGGGWADVQDLGQGLLRVTFDPATLIIPDLSWRTTTLFMLPIPPPLNIAITPQRLEGVINTVTGEVNLDFDAEFVFSIGPLYRAPPLVVRTVLTTEVAQGRQRSGIGSRVMNGAVRLGGVAQVERTGDGLIDNFLMLPADAFALMSAELEFQ